MKLRNFGGRLVRNEFDCESRGEISVKGADRMEVWRVLGRKSVARARPSRRDALNEPAWGT
jgi:hypothetical protein